MENAGTDATIPFQSKGHSNDAIDLLKDYCIGELIEVFRLFSSIQINDLYKEMIN